MTWKELRAHAEDAIRVTRREVAALAGQDVQRLVHELQVHQVELEMQNESLRSVQFDLEESQTQYQMLFECAPVGYVLLDASGAIVRANRAALSLFDLPRADLIGRRFAAFVSAEDSAQLRQVLHSAHREPAPSCEIGLRSNDGSTRLMHLDIKRVLASDTDYLIVLTDISERKRALDELERLNRRLAAQNEEIAARNQQLETEIERSDASEHQRRALEARLHASERLESLGLLAAGIAHDFNNLLLSMTGNAEILLLTPGLLDSWRAPLALIKRAGGHATDLTRQLLEFAGRGQLTTTAVDLPELVVENLELLRARLPDGVRLRSVPPPPLPSIAADRGQVNQVVMNLVSNAIDALDGDGAIDVELHVETLDRAMLDQFQHHNGVKPGSYLILQVQDDGPGIEAATLTHIFDPFFSTKLAGRGLGLATVLGIVQAHGGALRVRANPGEGTCFEVAFPLPPHAPALARESFASELAWSGTGRVLLIEDDDCVREVIGRLLMHLGFDVISADGGARGLELLRQAKPRFEFVVLDWMMPGFSGRQVLKVLRALEPQLPVILLSGYAAEYLDSADEHVVRAQKPVSLAELRDAVEQAIGSEHATKH